MSLPCDPALKTWLEKCHVPAVPNHTELRKYATDYGNVSESERKRIRDISIMFGGAKERYNGCEESFNKACDLLSDYFSMLEEAKAASSAIDRSTTTKSVVAGCLRILASYFPFCAEAYRTLAFVFQEEGLYRIAIQCFNKSVECYRATNPELFEPDADIAWGYVEQRPYLRTLKARAMCFDQSGDYVEAKKQYESLLKLVPSNNLSDVRQLLFFLLLKMGDYKAAQVQAKQNKDDGADFHYGRLIIEYVKFTRGDKTEVELDRFLVKALDQNPLVPRLLMQAGPLPPRPSTVSRGGMREAICVAYNIKEAWDRTGGITDWLKSVKNRDGAKPPTSTELFELLKTRNIIIKTRDGTDMIVTTNVRGMFGRGLSDFCVPPGTKSHGEGQPLVMFRNEQDKTDWYTIRFDDIVEVPFWKAYSMYKQERPSDRGYCSFCYKSAKEDGVEISTCSKCGVADYCSRECQVKAWRGGDSKPPHKKECKRLCKKD